MAGRYAAETEVPVERSKRQMASIVYFARMGPYVKIEHTINLKQRLSAIRTSAPEAVEAIYWCPGAQGEEKRYHRLFSAAHLRGEWFRLDGPITQYLGLIDHFIEGLERATDG